MANRYKLRGVSSDKEDVHNAIKNQDKGLFPKAFCKILPDYISNSDEHALIIHSDGAGTKSSLAYIYWKETSDLSVWKGIAQDSIVMNLDDVACVGAIDNIVLSSTIGRNKNKIPGEVISKIISGTDEILSYYRSHGINIYSGGGETADVGDITKTILVDSTVFAREKRNKIIECNIKDGDVIVGLCSYGKSKYEKEYNSGIGSNGLTSARHDILHKIYAEKYPETYANETKNDLIYCGKNLLTDKCKTHKNIGKLLLSPTRTYSPIIKKIIENYFNKISGIIHCTGGGQTKILHFVNNKRIIKNELFKIPEIFEIIHQDTESSFKEMYEVFNMGHRMEIYCSQTVANDIIDISKEFNVDAKVIGFVENSSKNELIIKTKEGKIEY